MLWDPIRYAETCPSSDGAFAMVLADEAAGEASAASRATAGVDPRHGHALRARRWPRAGTSQPAGRHWTARPTSIAQAGITNPREQIDVAEMYVPFSWYEPMWLENLGFAEEGEGWKLTESGATQMTGDLPGELLGRRAVDQPDRRLRHDPLRRGRHAGPRHAPATTRSTAPGWPSATPTAAAPSSSPCGSWARTSPESHPQGDERLREERMWMWVVGADKP